MKGLTLKDPTNLSIWTPLGLDMPHRGSHPPLSGVRATVRRRTRPAAGAPTVGGTPQVGEELTASASDISDADGLDDASFAYQWIRTDTDIEGATGSAYTVVDADEGEALKVRVDFTDDAGNEGEPHQRGDRCRRGGARPADGELREPAVGARRGDGIPFPRRLQRAHRESASGRCGRTRSQ